MPEELIDVCDGNGKRTGERKAKWAVHRDGDWHRAVHVWIVTPELRILLQKRASLKENYPGLWDVSFAGHLSAGEDARAAAIREGAEEIGVDVEEDSFEYVTTTREAVVLNGGKYRDNEVHEIYVVRRPVDPATLRLQKEEVDEVQLVSLDELAHLTSSPDSGLVPHEAEYRALLQHLRR
jgi:isopentenyl-diphosphate delta-isomerase type 1